MNFVGDIGRDPSDKKDRSGREEKEDERAPQVQETGVIHIFFSFSSSLLLLFFFIFCFVRPFHGLKRGYIRDGFLRYMTPWSHPIPLFVMSSIYGNCSYIPSKCGVLCWCHSQQSPDYVSRVSLSEICHCLHIYLFVLIAHGALTLPLVIHQLQPEPKSHPPELAFGPGWGFGSQGIMVLSTFGLTFRASRRRHIISS